MSQLTRHATFFVRTVKCGFLSDSSTPKGRPMERAVITAVADLRCRHVDLSKSQLETMALLTVGMIGARRVNLVHVADERGSCGVEQALTCRRRQRFLQHVRLSGDRAAPQEPASARTPHRARPTDTAQDPTTAPASPSCGTVSDQTTLKPSSNGEKSQNTQK
jgi:hypothetical protein